MTFDVIQTTPDCNVYKPLVQVTRSSFCKDRSQRGICCMCLCRTRALRLRLYIRGVYDAAKPLWSQPLKSYAVSAAAINRYAAVAWQRSSVSSIDHWDRTLGCLCAATVGPIVVQMRHLS